MIVYDTIIMSDINYIISSIMHINIIIPYKFYISQDDERS